MNTATTETVAPVTITLREMARAFEAGKAPKNGYYLPVDNLAAPGYYNITDARFRRSASGRRTGIVETTYFTTGRKTGTAVYCNIDEPWEII